MTDSTEIEGIKDIRSDFGWRLIEVSRAALQAHPLYQSERASVAARNRWHAPVVLILTFLIVWAMLAHIVPINLPGGLVFTLLFSAPVFFILDLCLIFRLRWLRRSQILRDLLLGPGSPALHLCSLAHAYRFGRRAAFCLFFGLALGLILGFLAIWKAGGPVVGTLGLLIALLLLVPIVGFLWWEGHQRRKDCARFDPDTLIALVQFAVAPEKVFLLFIHMSVLISLVLLGCYLARVLFPTLPVSLWDGIGIWTGVIAFHWAKRSGRLLPTWDKFPKNAKAKDVADAFRTFCADED